MSDGSLVVITALIAVIAWNINIKPVFKTVAIELAVFAVLLIPFGETWIMKIIIAVAIIAWNTRLHPTVKNVVIGIAVLIAVLDYIGFADEVRNLLGFL